MEMNRQSDNLGKITTLFRGTLYAPLTPYTFGLKDSVQSTNFYGKLLH